MKVIGIMIKHMVMVLFNIVMVIYLKDNLLMVSKVEKVYMFTMMAQGNILLIFNRFEGEFDGGEKINGVIQFANGDKYEG